MKRQGTTRKEGTRSFYVEKPVISRDVGIGRGSLVGPRCEGRSFIGLDEMLARGLERGVEAEAEAEAEEARQKSTGRRYKMLFALLSELS